MVAIPLVKLFSLTVKTLAKPVAKRIKSEAQKHQTVRGILNQMGQTVNSISLRVNIRIAGHKTTKIKPLEEDKAVAAGGELLAEGFVYAVAGGLVVWEYVSSAKEKEAKDSIAKAKKAKEQKDLEDALEVINQRLGRLEAASRNQTQKPGGRAGDGHAPDAYNRWRQWSVLGLGGGVTGSSTAEGIVGNDSVKDSGILPQSGESRDGQRDSDGGGGDGGNGDEENRLTSIVSRVHGEGELKDRGPRNSASGAEVSSSSSGNGKGR